MPIPLSFQLQGLDAALEKFSPKRVAAASRNAGDQAGRQLVTQTVKLIGARRGLKAGFIREGVILKRPGAGAALEEQRWSVHISGKRIPLSQFSPRQTSRGVSVTVTRGQPKVVEKTTFSASGGLQRSFRTTRERNRKLLAHAFLTTVGGHRGVFIRGTSRRLPIYELFGPSLAGSVRAGDPEAAGLLRAAQDRYQSAFSAQLQRLER